MYISSYIEANNFKCDLTETKLKEIKSIDLSIFLGLLLGWSQTNGNNH